MWQKKSWIIEITAFLAVLFFLFQDVHWGAVDHSERLRAQVKSDLAKIKRSRGKGNRGNRVAQRSTAPRSNRNKVVKRRKFNRNPVKRDPTAVQTPAPKPERVPTGPITIISPPDNTVIIPTSVTSFRLDGTCSAQTVTIHYPGRTRYAVCKEGRYFAVINMQAVPDGKVPMVVTQVDTEGKKSSFTRQFFKNAYSHPK